MINRMPEEGCEFCSVLDDERPDVCWECPHDPDAKCGVAGCKEWQGGCKNPPEGCLGA